MSKTNIDEIIEMMKTDIPQINDKIDRLVDEELSSIEGGFHDKGQVLLARNVAKYHNKEINQVNQIITNHYNRFKGLVIDLKENENLASYLIEKEIITQKDYESSDHIFLISERGFLYLEHHFMDDMSWVITEKFLDDILHMNEPISNSEKGTRKRSFNDSLGIPFPIKNDKERAVS